MELMTVVAILGVLMAMAAPNMVRMLQRQETKTSATQMAGLLSDARSHAITEGTPHLVYFNAPSVDANGECGVAAVEVRDADHSYSITDGDQTHEFRLPASACQKVKPYDGSTSSGSAPATVPMPAEDLAVRASDASVVGAVVATASNTVGAAASTVASVVGGVLAAPAASPSSDSSGSEDSGSDSSGSGKSGSAASVTGVAPGLAVAVLRTSTVSETVVNGATFPVDDVSGRAVVAFSEHGIPVDPKDPNAWGSGAGGIYLTDGDSTIYAALVAPLGDVKLRAYDPSSQTWK